MDRGYPCEKVYSAAFDRWTDHDVIDRLDEVYASMHAKIVIPRRSSYASVKDQFESITPEKLEEIDKLYVEFAHWTRCEVLMLNVDDEDLKREISEIEDFVYDRTCL